VTFLCRVQRSDLPGQVVIPGPGRELEHAHRHMYPKRVDAVAGCPRDPIPHEQAAAVYSGSARQEASQHASSGLHCRGFLRGPKPL